MCVDKLCVDKLCVGKLCVDKLCVDKLCVDKLCVDKLCVDKLCVDSCVWTSCVWTSRSGGEAERRRCRTKNKNPTQRCGQKYFYILGGALKNSLSKWYSLHFIAALLRLWQSKSIVYTPLVNNIV